MNFIRKHFKINTWRRSEVSVHPGLCHDTTLRGGKCCKFGEKVADRWFHQSTTPGGAMHRTGLCYEKKMPTTLDLLIRRLTSSCRIYGCSHRFVWFPTSRTGKPAGRHTDWTPGGPGPAGVQVMSPRPVKGFLTEPTVRLQLKFLQIFHRKLMDRRDDGWITDPLQVAASSITSPR